VVAISCAPKKLCLFLLWKTLNKTKKLAGLKRKWKNCSKLTNLVDWEINILQQTDKEKDKDFPDKVLRTKCWLPIIVSKDKDVNIQNEMPMNRISC
jgi:disulfide oxidoreductase YuzD